MGRLMKIKTTFMSKMSVTGMIWDRAQHNFGSMISHVPLWVRPYEIFSLTRKSQKINLIVAAVMSYTRKLRHK